MKKEESEVLMTEHAEQREFVQFFRRTWPDVRIFAIPNGGPRSLSAAARLRAEGVSKGVLDLFVPEWLLWIEMKKKTNAKLSKEQIDWIEYLEAVGYRCIVAMGADDAIQKISKMKIAQRKK